MLSEEIVKILKVDTNESEKSLKTLRKEIMLLKNELLNLDEDTEEYNQVLAAAADRSFQLRDINESVKYSANDLGERIATVSRITTGLASGFGAAQGAVALFGGESETLQKTMVQLQGAIALVQGLQGIEGLGKDLRDASIQFRDSIKSIKTFIGSLSTLKKALISTGIGALAVGVGLLIANFDKLKNAIKGVKDESFKYQEAVEDTKRSLSSFDSELDLKVRLLEVEGKSTLEIINYKRQQIREEIAGINKTLEGLRSKQDLNENEINSIKELEDIEASRYAQLQELNNDATIEEVKLQKKRKEDAEKEYEERLKRLKAEEEEKQKILYNNKILDQKRQDEQIKELEALAEKRKEIIAEQIKNDYLLYTSQIEGINLFNEDNLRTINLKYNIDSDDELANLDNQIKKEFELQNLRDIIFEKRIKAIDDLSKNENLSFEESFKLDKERLLLVKKYEQETKDSETSINEYVKQKEIEKQKIRELQLNTYLSIASDTFSSLSDILGEETAAGKAAAVAQATISTYLAANQAYSALAGIPIVGPALGAAAAAAAIVAGIANVKNILSVDTSSTSASVPNASSNITNSANVRPNISLDAAMPISYTRNLLGNNEYEELNKPTKVYVLESDITNAQKKVKVVENNATF